MKTEFILILFLLVSLLGCKEEGKIEIIPDYDRIYLPPNELSESPRLLNGDSSELIDSITAMYGKLYSFADTVKNKPTMKYKFMINENGEIEKVFFGKNNDGKINQLVLNTIMDWKFKPGMKDGKIVKSQFPMILWFTTGKSINESEYFVAVEQMPSPIGGIKAIQEKIVYPEAAKNAGIEGKVYILAFIDEEGNVDNTKIIKGIGGGCDDAAIDAVLKTKFIPGKQRGKPVKVQVSIPIMFKLN